MYFTGITTIIGLLENLTPLTAKISYNNLQNLSFYPATNKNALRLK